MLINLNTLKTFYNALIQRMKKSRGNWNQNDPTADDYIKNRPFYSDGVQEVEILPETTINVEDAYSNIYDPFSIVLKRGQTYTVVFDGVIYQCVAKETYSNEPFIGNSSILGWNDDKNTGEPFFIDVWIDGDYAETTFAATTAGSHTISISTIAEVVHQIDKKYVPIPDGLVTENDMWNIMDDVWSNLSDVAFSGDYNDLDNTPTIYTDVVRYNTTQSLSSSQKDIARANIGASDFSGDYNDLDNRPVYQTFVDDVVYVKWDSDPISGVAHSDGAFESYRYGYVEGTTQVPILGEIYEIRINDEVFEAEYRSDGGSNYFGNPALKYDYKADTGETFYLNTTVSLRGYVSYEIYMTTQQDITLFSVTKKSHTDYHQLDEHYIPDTIARVDDVNEAFSTKQDTLVSGTNIKTINGTSILGSGDITIEGGSSANIEAITDAEINTICGATIYYSNEVML